MHELQTPPTSQRVAGATLFASAVLTVVFMAMHPTRQTHGLLALPAEAASGMHHIGPIHGILIGLSLVTLVGFLGLGELLGASTVVVRLALTLLCAGTAAGVVAGLINGFIVPAAAASFTTANVAAIEALEPVLRVCAAANATCARFDVVCLSVAAMLLSSACWRVLGALVVGVTGVACGAVPLVLLATSDLPMTVHGFGTFVVFQAIWAGSAGALLLRKPR